MNCTYVSLIVLVCGFVAVLILLCVILNNTIKLCEQWERGIGYLSWLKGSTQKFDKALDWLLERKGMRLDYRSGGWMWSCTSEKDWRRARTAEDILKNPEGAIYLGVLGALREFENEKKEAKKGGRK